MQTTCGHAPTPSYYPAGATVTVLAKDGTTQRIDVGGKPFTSGTATTQDGRVLCYPCAEAEELESFMAAGAGYSAYLSSDGKNVTTWTGAALARVTEHGTARTGFHGSEIHYIRAKDTQGREWYGKNGGPGMFIGLKLAKHAR